MSESVDEYIARLKNLYKYDDQIDRMERLLWICLAHLYELQEKNREKDGR